MSSEKEARPPGIGRATQEEGGATPSRTPFDSSREHPALIYARLGCVVLPLLREGKGNRPHPMLGSGWTRDTVGSRDPDVIGWWWEQDPGANIGVVNGPRSGFLIIDVDRKPGRPNGMKSLWEWMDEVGDLPDCPYVRTPSGGLHLWYRMPESEEVPIPKVWLPSVEVPWQVAVPPSVRYEPMTDHQTREQYHIEVAYTWARLLDEPPVAPEALLDAVRTLHAVPTSNVSAGAAGEVSGSLPPTEWFLQNGFGGFTGSRNQDCYRLAWRLWNRHPHDGRLVMVTLYRVWQQTTQDGHSFLWQEVVKCAASAERRVRQKRESELSLVPGWSR